MDPEIADEIAELLNAIQESVGSLEIDARKFAAEILPLLSNINSTLYAIDRNLTLMEMKE